jgi:hypothetical protein
MNFSRLAASAAILTMLSAGLALARPAAVTSDVNLRKGPGTDSEVITLIPRGTMVEVGPCTNGWCEVSWNGQNGYSIATNLGLGGPRFARRPPPGPGDGGDYPPPPGGAYPPPPAVVVGGPPVYYGPYPYYARPYYGYGPGWYGGGWGWRRRW